MSTISLCMVVRDEATTLAGAIQSVAGVVDEVVIGVDDACTDDTPAIAKAGASAGKLFTFHFENDFAAIRNECIKRADGDMILILDGHEFIAPDDHIACVTMARMRNLTDQDRVPTPLATLRYIKQNGFTNDARVCCVTTMMNVDPGGVPQLFFLQPRLFLNDGQICYQHAVHNALTGYKREQTCAYRDILLVHNMPAGRESQRKVQRKAMNASGLWVKIKAAHAAERAYRAEHGKDMPLGERDGRSFFYMGNTYADQGNSKKALYWYKQYLARSGFGDEKYQALQQLAVITHRSEHDTERAIAYAQEAERLCYNRAEPCVLRAEIAIDNKDWKQAIHWLDRAEKYPAPDTVMFMQGPVYSYLPSMQKATCYIELKDWPKAIAELENVLTWRPGSPEIIQEIINCRNHLRRERSKPNMLFIDRMGSFSRDIAQHYADKDWAVVRREDCDMRWKGWADIAWFEWCDANIVEWSRHTWSGPVVCRLHSYETYTEWPGQVVWENVSHLVFVAEHIRDLVFQRWPDIQKRVKTSVIPNGVDPAKFTFKPHGPGKRIAFLGYINSKKSPDGLVTLARMYPDYEFHIGGKPQEGNVWDDFLFQIADLHNVWYHGWIENQNDWLDDMDYLVSPSIIESFGYTIAEAALKGIKPLVRHRMGTKNLWPEQWIYHGPADLKRLLEEPYDPVFNRKWIEDHYTLQRQIELTDELVHQLLGSSHSTIQDVYANFKLQQRLDTGIECARSSA